MFEVFRNPDAEQYRQRTRHTVGETISLEAFPDVRLEIAQLF
jgi:Uma2 family endonuclease